MISKYFSHSKYAPLTQKEENEISLRYFLQERGEDNSERKKAMVASVKRAIQQELTLKQQQVFVMYYCEQRRIPEIAALLGLNKSTVARHLKIARERLRRVFSYAMIPIAVEQDLRCGASFQKKSRRLSSEQAAQKF